MSITELFKMFSAVIVLSALIASAYSLTYAVDSSTLVSKTTYQHAFNSGYTKAIIRGYSEACGSGGQVDPNFVSSYTNARAAGFTDIDVYWFPCNGSGNNCKSYATQLSELSATFRAQGMGLGRIWIDIEKDSAICNNVSIP